MFNRKCTDIRPNHFKSALGGATYVYASWDSLPPSVDGAEPRTEAQTRLWHSVLASDTLQRYCNVISENCNVCFNLK